jgi:hypothetical protein
MLKEIAALVRKRNEFRKSSYYACYGDEFGYLEQIAADIKRIKGVRVVLRKRKNRNGC